MQTIYLVTGLPGVGKTSFLQVLEGLKLLPEYSVTPQKIARIYNSSETYAMQKLIDDGRSFLCELPLEQEKMEQFFGLLEGKTYAINCYCMGLPDAAEAIARLVRRDRTGVPTAKILEDFELFPSNIRELSRRVESIKFFDNTHGFCLTGYYSAGKFIHNHFVINSVSFLDGKRLWKEKNYWQMRTVSDALCREYGLSLIKPVRRGMPYAAWQAEKEGKPNRRKALREDIDRILANENIESLEAFYDTLRAYGYAVMTDRKYVAICPPGGERNIRLQSLGENYEPEALHLRILRIKADRLLGKTKVIEQPTMQKRRMRLRETVRRKSKAHGIRALYYKWLYYLGVFKRRPKVYGSAFTTARWQLNAYIKQFDYVAKYNLKTRDDVEQRLRVVQHEISGQIDEREEIRAVLRCLETGDAEIQEQLEKIEKINAQLKKLRSEAKLCVQILEQQPQIKSKIDKAHEVKTFETERGKENGRASDYHLEHRRNEAAPTREQRSSGSARSSDSIQRR